jgi:hypothetical protein
VGAKRRKPKNSHKSTPPAHGRPSSVTTKHAHSARHKPLNFPRLFGRSNPSQALSGAASAESLRCSNGIVAEGDSRIAVAYKCGEPTLRDSYCAAVSVPPTHLSPRR